MRRVVLLSVVLFLLAAACGGDDTAATTTTSSSAPTTTSPPTTAPATTAAPTTAAPATTAAPETTTTTSSVDSDEPECLRIWSEELVMATAGERFSFFEANIDGSTCTYVAVPDSVGIFFRDGGQVEYDFAKTGAGLTGDVMDAELCDAGYYLEIGGAIFIMEALDLANGRIYNATLTGVTEPLAAATALLNEACA